MVIIPATPTHNLPSCWSILHISKFHPALDMLIMIMMVHLLHDPIPSYIRYTKIPSFTSPNSIMHYYIMKFHPTLDIPNSIMVVHLSHNEIPSCIRHITQFHPALHHEIPSFIRYTKSHHGSPPFT